MPLHCYNIALGMSYLLECSTHLLRRVNMKPKCNERVLKKQFQLLIKIEF